MRFDGCSSVFSCGGSTATISRPSSPDSTSARTTSPTATPAGNRPVATVPFGCLAPAARQVKVPSPVRLVSSISIRRGMRRSRYRLGARRCGAPPLKPAEETRRWTRPLGLLRTSAVGVRTRCAEPGAEGVLGGRLRLTRMPTPVPALTPRPLPVPAPDGDRAKRATLPLRRPARRTRSPVSPRPAPAPCTH